MAVVHDTSSKSAVSTGVASFSWSHAGSASIAGIVVFVVVQADADHLTSVTYGGITLTEHGTFAQDTATEPGRCYVCWLGASVPTGTQTVEVTRVNNAVNMMGIAASVTSDASRDIELYGTSFTTDNNDGTLAERNIDDGSPGSDSIRYCGGWSGRTIAQIGTGGTNSTLLQQSNVGSGSMNACRETTPGQGSRPVGFSAGTSDDRAMTYFALREIIAAGPPGKMPKASASALARRRL